MARKKSTTQSVIFVSAATLGRSEYLNDRYFSRDYFDYIVVDDYAIIGLSQEAA